MSSWETSTSANVLNEKLQSQPSVNFGTPQNSVPTVKVSPTQTGQSVDGFGGALTDSSAQLISQSPDESAIMNALFSSSGANFNIVRVPMGGSDFVSSLSRDTSYDDNGGSLQTPGSPDSNMSTFCVGTYSGTCQTSGGDYTNTIPLLQDALNNYQSSLKVLSTPWSAPGWMKIDDGFVPSSCSGSNDYLQQKYFSDYAKYFVDYVEAYEKADIPISVVSLQNEPHNCSTTYPTMEMEPADEAQLAEDLASAFTKAHKSGAISQVPAILGWDHNWFDIPGDPSGPCSVWNTSLNNAAQYPITLLGEKNLNDAITYIGYHHYCGNAYAQQDLTAQYPPYSPQDTSGTHIWMTEATGINPTDVGDQASNLVYEVLNDLMEPFWNGSSASLYFNLATNPDGGPAYGGCDKTTSIKSSAPGGSGCRGMISVNSDGSWTENEDYYYWSQFSKFIEPRAVRIGSTSISNGTAKQDGLSPPLGNVVANNGAAPAIDTVAFKNPDGSIVLVALNTQPDPPIEGVISSGNVELGVNSTGDLNVAGGPPSCEGTTTIGLRYLPTNCEFAGPGCPCEGWGVANPATGTTGFADQSTGTSGLIVRSFTTTSSTADSVVQVGSTFDVTNDYSPVSNEPDLFQDQVTIKNITTSTISNVLYRRLVDWDMEPTAYDEYITIQGMGNSSHLISTTDDGFDSADPLSVSSNLGATGNFVMYGPFDQGAEFNFNFGSLKAGNSTTFTEYYGASNNEADALADLVKVGVEAYSFGEPSVDLLGDPNTAILAFSGIGGSKLTSKQVNSAIAEPDIFPNVSRPSPNTSNGG